MRFPPRPDDVESPSARFDPTDAAAALSTRLPWPPEVLLVLGSGLSPLADAVESAVTVPFEDLPGFPRVGVTGHAGRYVAGLLEGRRVLVQAGRFHLYEGHEPGVVTGPIRVAARVGVRTALLTNAAGGIDPRMEPGSLMLLDDHIDLTWGRPLAGPVAAGETRFPDMSAPYDAHLQALAERVALELGIPLGRGVYAAVAGPQYETPAEVRMLARAGAHVVGMSTVPEVVAARAAGIRCLAVSLVTNRAAGTGGGPLAHDDVVSMGRSAGVQLGRLLGRIVAELPA